MPIFDYKCTKCLKTCEVLCKESFSEALTCPYCNKKKTLKRLISPPSMIKLKGSGFYATDHLSTEEKLSKKGFNSDGKSTTQQYEKEARSEKLFGESDWDEVYNFKGKLDD